MITLQLDNTMSDIIGTISHANDRGDAIDVLGTVTMFDQHLVFEPEHDRVFSRIDLEDISLHLRDLELKIIS